MSESERAAAIRAVEKALETENDSAERSNLHGALEALEQDQRDARRRRSS